MGKTILIIDDNNDIRENTSEILELAGYSTITADNGKKGVEAAGKHKPDLIICDIMMPELDGYGVLHLLRKNTETQYIPLIFLTAKAERSDLRKGMEMGADDYITKPFDDIELLNAVEARLKKTEMFSRAYENNSGGFSDFLKDVENAGLIKGFADKYEEVKYIKKQEIYSEAKRPRFLFYITRGKVKTYKTHEDGKEYITSLYSDGDFLGYTALLQENNYDDNAIAMEECEIMQIPKDDFLQMVYSDPSIASKFIHIITRNVKEQEERLMNLAYSTLRKRVAKALTSVVEKFHLEGSSGRIEISREELAQYIGTATESLIRTLSDFKAEKLIDIKTGKIIVTDVNKLKKLLY